MASVSRLCWLLTLIITICAPRCAKGNRLRIDMSLNINMFPTAPYVLKCARSNLTVETNHLYPFYMAFTVKLAFKFTALNTVISPNALNG